MNQGASITYSDNPAVKDRLDRYKTVTVDVAKILKSWKLSLYAFEYLTKDGQVKGPEALPDDERIKIEHVAAMIKQNKDLPRPVMGIGLLENVEIGAGRDVFLCLAHKGAETVSVHIPKSNEDEFEGFYAG